MFLEQTLARNAPLVETAFALWQEGALLPDSYVIDLDTLEENARAILAAGEKHRVHNYFMTKQLGRNPLVARRLAALGFSGAVCVDFREALALAGAGVPLGHVGHLVQPPRQALAAILAAQPQILTVYSAEKAAEVSALCAGAGRRQPLMLRVVREQDLQYPGQCAGVPLSALDALAAQILALPNVELAGVTGFPCFLYDEAAEDIRPTPNLDTVLEAAERLRKKGCGELQVNLPSATCARSIPLIAAAGGTHGEPGHGLTGTTPYHARHPEAAERPALVYLSEVSHNYGGHGYCYGGGWYRRGHLQNALVGPDAATACWMGAAAPPEESIDYHLTLERPCRVSDAVVMAFRTQIFVTRSQVAVVSGISAGRPRVEGVFTAQGHPLRGEAAP